MIARRGWTKPAKYKAKPTLVDGVRFASQKEAHRYAELKLLEKAGEIHALDVHPSWDLIAHDMAGRGVVVGKYTADFWYVGKQGLVVEDVKGGRATKTEAYRLRKKIVQANYGIRIIEV